MLGRSYKTALPFAEDLVRRGVLLLAAPSTVLGELCALSAPIEGEIKVASGQNNDELEQYGDQLEYHSSAEFGQFWNASFDNSVDNLAKIVSTHVSYIKNVVRERVVEFTKETQAFIESLGRSDAAANLTIERGSMPELVQDQAFLGMLETYRGRNVVPPSKYSLEFAISNAPDDFTKIASTSNGRLDSMIASWVASSDFNYLQSTWHTFFVSGEANKTFKGPYLSQDDMKSPNLFVRLNTSLAYYLLANYYVNHLPDIVTSEPTSSLERRIREHLEYAATTLIKTLDMLLDNNNASIMISYVDQFHKKITVSADVYDRWLATGGEVETILGMLVSGKFYPSVREIDEKANQLKQEWANYVRVHVETIEYQKSRLLRDFYIQLLMKFQKPDYQEDVECSFLSSNAGFTGTTVKKAEAWLKEQTKEQLLDSYRVAKELIAGGKYGFTYAKKFLNDMEEIGAISDNVIPEEAAFVATVNYIADFILGQIQVKNI